MEHYSWKNKSYNQMTKKEFQHFQESYAAIWHFFNVTNHYNLYGLDSEGKVIHFNTDISRRKLTDYSWVSKTFDEISVGELMEESILFYDLMFNLVIINGEEFRIMGWKERKTV